ncbi:hypothetical protein NE865_05136 [Phthorimaea operculella]|nr:hypothetical protein NE865_05136 [Phthorimaea operculella]
MSSKLVKCSGCNVVIDEVLAFVNNKIDVMTEESISKICISAFSPTDISNAKELLYSSLSQKKKKRKGDGKKQRDIEDIIYTLKSTPSEEIPVFVARDLQKLPPVLFDHVDVTRLLKDLVKLQRDVQQIQDQYATKDELKTLKSDLETLKTTSVINNYNDVGNVNTKRGAYLGHSFECDSGPMGLNHITYGDGSVSPKVSPIYRDMSVHSTDKNWETSKIQSPRKQGPLNSSCHQNQQNLGNNASLNNISRETTFNKQLIDAPTKSMSHAAQSDNDHGPASVMGHTAAPSGPVAAAAAMPSCESIDKSLADIIKDGNWKEENNGNDWTFVEPKKKKYRFLGRKGNAVTGPNVNFKANDVKVPLFIYNVSKEVTDSGTTSGKSTSNNG